jgi:hypothetical protein
MLRPTPRAGGLAIVACHGCPAAVLAGFSIRVDRPARRAAAAGARVAAVSLARRHSNPADSRRLLAHVAASVVVTRFRGARPSGSIVGTFGRCRLGPAAWPLTLLWIVGLTNAFNFMDGIDGIAGITAAAAGIAIAAAAAWLGSPAVAAVAAAFAGGVDRVSDLELAPGADLHGRRRQHILRVPAGRHCPSRCRQDAKSPWCCLWPWSLSGRLSSTPRLHDSATAASVVKTSSIRTAATSISDWLLAGWSHRAVAGALRRHWRR